MKSRWLQSPVIYFYNQPQAVIWNLEEMGDCYEIPCILGLGYGSCLWLLKDLQRAQEMSQAFPSSSWSQYEHQGQFSPVMWESIQVWAKFSLVILLCGFFPITLFLLWLFPQLALFWSHCFFFFYLLFFFLLISSPSLSLHLVGTVLSLLLSWVNMIKSSEGSLCCSGRGSRTARVMPGARGAAGYCFGSTTCLTAAPLIWPPRALSLSLSVLRGRINRADGNILFPAGSIR